jgi:DNA polymerase V
MGIIEIMFHKIGSSGFPSPADDFLEAPIDLNQYLISHPAATFFVRVIGERNQHLGINDKDVLIIDRALKPAVNQIFVAKGEREFSLRRFNGSRDQQINYELWGVVAYIIRSTLQK